MQLPAPAEEIETIDPIESVAHFIAHQDWPMKQDGNRVQFAVVGGRSDYDVTYLWDNQQMLMHFTLAFTQLVKLRRRTQYRKLIEHINACLEFGHFERHPEESLTVFRSSIPLLDRDIMYEEANFLLQAGIDATEAYQHFFDCVACGMSADDAFAQGQLLYSQQSALPN